MWKIQLYFVKALILYNIVQKKSTPEGGGNECCGGQSALPTLRHRLLRSKRAAEGGCVPQAHPVPAYRGKQKASLALTKPAQDLLFRFLRSNLYLYLSDTFVLHIQYGEMKIEIVYFILLTVLGKITEPAH